jgi:hypothetical protein
MDKDIHAGGLLRRRSPAIWRHRHPSKPASEQVESRTHFPIFQPCSPKDEQGFFVSTQTTTMKTKIQSELSRIENERGVQVLYAVESGSRAWGFASTDSDYDRRDYLRGDVVWLKKYLYVLRPICACRWIERGHGPVPMEFSKLVNKTIDDVMLRFAIADLVVRKRNGEELDRAPRVPVISEFVESELARLADIAPEKTEPPPVTELDAFFRNTLLKAA